jgi:formylglycine-generating enzyme required for sulfatase activity
VIHLLLALLSPAWAGVNIPPGQKLDGDGDPVPCTPADWGWKDQSRNCPVPQGKGVTIPTSKKLDASGYFAKCGEADWGWKDKARNCPVPQGAPVTISAGKKLDASRYFAKCDPADAGIVDATHNCPRPPPTPPPPPAAEKVARQPVEAPKAPARLPVAPPVPGSVVEEAGLRWVTVPAGSGQIGDDKEGASDEKPAFRVEFTAPFEMLETEVTNRQYARLIPGHKRVDDEPVVIVTWHQAKAWCEAAGGRLPTELEWEYAARAGGEGAYGLGQGGEVVTTLNLRSYAWLSPTDEYDPKATTHPVKQKKPNAWGLYDLWGNVWEWTLDGYEDTAWKQLQAGGKRDDTSDNVVITDPGFVDTIDNAPPDHRVFRGGSAWNGPGYLRSGDRGWDSPSLSDGDLGFRCVRAPARHPLNLTN